MPSSLRSSVRMVTASTWVRLPQKEGPKRFSEDRSVASDRHVVPTARRGGERAPTGRIHGVPRYPRIFLGTFGHLAFLSAAT
jgi:hypothetical protein